MKNTRLLLFLLLIPFETVLGQHVSDIGFGWAGNSVNTVVFRRNSLVSYRGEQFAAYYDTSGYVSVAKRKLGTDVWEIHRTHYTGNYRDAHNSISIIIDGEGYLHVSWDQHASKLRYCKSVKPGSLELGAEEQMIGRNENRVTYPEFYKLKNGDLLFLYRDGASGQGNLVLNRYDHERKAWLRIQDNLIDGEGKRNAYWQACVDKDGVFHISWVWRESSDVSSNHDLCYAKSADGGKSWSTSKNDPYQMPIKLASAERIVNIPQKSELINSTSMTTNGKGEPYIATYWCPQGSQIPQYHLIYFNGREWSVKQISNRTTPFSLSGSGTKRIPISRPQLVIDNNRGFLIFRDTERNDKVSVLYSNEISKGQWIIKDISKVSYGQWEPSYDTALWEQQRRLHLFVQKTGQGDGEAVENIRPQMISVIECNL